jgi:hypothetical protein
MRVHQNALNKFKNFINSIDRTGTELAKMNDNIHYKTSLRRMNNGNKKKI